MLTLAAQAGLRASELTGLRCADVQLGTGAHVSCLGKGRKQKVTAHVPRHTAAMRLLFAGVDTTVIALWLGHEQVETTQIYLHANLAIKEQAP